MLFRRSFFFQPGTRLRPPEHRFFPLPFFRGPAAATKAQIGANGGPLALAVRLCMVIALGKMFSCPPLTNGILNVYHMTQGSWTLGLAGRSENLRFGHTPPVAGYQGRNRGKWWTFGPRSAALHGDCTWEDVLVPATDQWHNECISYDPGQLDSGARREIGESRICPYPL